MANKPLHAYTVAEASNLQVYESYKCETLTLDGTSVLTNTAWDTPAKEIILFAPAGTIDDDGITINFQVNGSYGDNILVNFDNLPFTVKGLLIEAVKLTGGSGDDDVITVLSFH